MHQGSRMNRVLRVGATIISIFTAGYGASWAQTVMGNSTPAQCVQNVDNRALACGAGATGSPGTGAMAIGVHAKATGDAAIALGYGSNAGSIAAMAIGQESNASNQGSVALGQGTIATGFSSTALGFAARALANDAVAVGGATSVGANFSTAIGANASANFESSTALGVGAEVKAANQIVLGTAQNIYVLPGANSAASASALKGPLKMLVIDANGNIGVADIPAPRP